MPGDSRASADSSVSGTQRSKEVAERVERSMDMRASNGMVRPVSSMPFSIYRKNPPQIYWRALADAVSSKKLRGFLGLIKSCLTGDITNGDRVLKLGPLVQQQKLGEPPADIKDYTRGAMVGESVKSQVYSGIFLKKDGCAEHYAVKSVSLGPSHDEDGLRQRRARAQREFELLAKLDHAHIIDAVGTFIETSRSRVDFGIILFPLARWNMEEYLHLVSTHNENQGSISSWNVWPDMNRFLSYFGCLCQAVLYLHKNNIRHRDIKPSNILIDAYGEVLLADMDVAEEYLYKISTFDDGCTEMLPFYAPQHVLEEATRGVNRDIFSLGCCFLEMATVVVGETVLRLHDFMKQTTEYITYADFVSQNRHQLWIEHLKVAGTESRSGWPFLESPQSLPKYNGTGLASFFRHITNMMSAIQDHVIPEDSWNLEEAARWFAHLSPQKCTTCTSELTSSDVLPAPSEEQGTTFELDVHRERLSIRRSVSSESLFGSLVQPSALTGSAELQNLFQSLPSAQMFSQNTASDFARQHVGNVYNINLNININHVNIRRRHSEQSFVTARSALSETLEIAST